MKNGILLHSIIIVLLALYACKPEEKECFDDPISEDLPQNNYDSLLAEKLGADEYGMRFYVMAFLKAGPNRDQDSTAKANLQRAHLDNISRLSDEGKLVVAGPFLDDGDIRGIYIFKVDSVEEAEALVKTDPAIKAGSLTMELQPWYGSAALQEINEIHKKVAKTKI
jgi:uncharacterized protein